MNYAVVILTKTVQNVQRCMDSIRNAGEECPVIVVDDGLTGKPRPAKPPGCCYIEGDKPFVFSRNANIGIRAAGESDVFLMNDDAELVTPGGFGKLADAAAGFGGIVSCAIRENVGNPLQLPRTPARFREYAHKTTLAFVCVFIPRRIYSDVGPLDEDFDGYGFEDNDYCLRTLQRGWKLAVFDGCVVGHRDGSTFRRDPMIDHKLERGRRVFNSKHPADQVAPMRAGREKAS